MSYQAWRDKAACRGADPDLFFPPEKGGKAQARKAKAICAPCPVKAECLAIAGPYGIWGGTAEGERGAPSAGPPPAPRVTRPAAASRYPGVTWKAQRRTWTARVPRDGKRKYLGSFRTEQEAWQAICEAEGLLQATSSTPQAREDRSLMLPAILGLVVVVAAAFVLAVLHVSRRLRRVMRAAGAAVVPPVRLRPPGGWRCQCGRSTFAMTGPFAYDDGVMTGRPDEEES